MKQLLIWLVRAWRSFVSPSYGPVCKYYPTCSTYALEALHLHGAIKGTALMIWRILRCNPWSGGGVDPVPGSQLETDTHQWWGEEMTDLSAEAAYQTHWTEESRLTAAQAVMG